MEFYAVLKQLGLNPRLLPLITDAIPDRKPPNQSSEKYKFQRIGTKLHPLNDYHGNAVLEFEDEYVSTMVSILFVKQLVNLDSSSDDDEYSLLDQFHPNRYDGVRERLHNVSLDLSSDTFKSD